MLFCSLLGLSLLCSYRHHSQQTHHGPPLSFAHAHTVFYTFSVVDKTRSGLTIKNLMIRFLLICVCWRFDCVDVCFFTCLFFFVLMLFVLADDSSAKKLSYLVYDDMLRVGAPHCLLHQLDLNRFWWLNPVYVCLYFFFAHQVLLTNTFCSDAFFKNNYLMTQLQKRKYHT